MEYPSLGSMIREKRSERGMTQQDVCEVLDWKDVYRLSEIEQGTRKPDLLVLRKLFVALRFGAEEQGLALYLSGYPPTEEEGDKWVNRLRDFIDSRDYAGYLHDFTWKLFYANDRARRIFGLDDNTLQRRENLLQLVLDPNNLAYDRVRNTPNWTEFLEAQVASFKEEHIHRTNEPWFRELLAKLMQNDEFARLWTELEEASLLRLRRKMMVYGYNSILLPSDVTDNEAAELRPYNIFNCPVVGDERFRLKLLLPARVEPEDVEQRRPVLA